MSPPTLTRLLKPLLSRGLIVEAAGRAHMEDGALGRPALPLDVPLDTAVYLGVKITADAVIAVLTNQRAETIRLAERPLSSLDPADVVDAVMVLHDELVGDTGTGLTAMGVTVGGPVSGNRLVRSVAWLHWKQVDLGGMLEQRAGIPVTVENDLIAFVDGVRWFGVGRELPDFAVVTIGAGIGHGLVRDHDLVHAIDTGLEVVGHYLIDPAGPACARGHRGCATAMLTVDAICARVEAATGQRLGYERIMELAAGGDPLAAEVVSNSARALGRLIAIAANLGMVNHVLVAGEGTSLFDVAGDEVRRALAADRDPDASPVTLMVDRSEFLNWAKGAAAAAIQASFDRAVSQA